MEVRKLQLTSQCDVSGVMVGNYRHRYLRHCRVLICERSLTTSVWTLIAARMPEKRLPGFLSIGNQTVGKYPEGDQERHT